MTVPPDADTWQTLDRFLAGEVSLTEFEQWVYVSTQLEMRVGPERHLAFLSLDYRAKHGLHEADKLVEETYSAFRPGLLERDRARRITTAFLAGTLDVVSACRALALLHYEGAEWVPVVLTGIDSELATVPRAADYAQWEPGALAAKLADARAAVDFYRPHAIAAAREVLVALDSERAPGV
jgi:hypothetical protein